MYYSSHYRHPKLLPNYSQPPMTILNYECANRLHIVHLGPTYATPTYYFPQYQHLNLLPFQPHYIMLGPQTTIILLPHYHQDDS